MNRQIRRHSKSSYSSLAIRAVAEQIDNLYWRSAEPDHEIGEDAEEENRVVQVEDDLSKERYVSLLNLNSTCSYLDSYITRVPALLEDLASSDPNLDLNTATSSFGQLQELVVRREELQRKQASYDKLLELLEPLGQPAGNIQPNLVTKDGPLAAELAKLRKLVPRVDGRLGVWIENRDVAGEVEADAEEKTEDRAEAEQEKLARVLAS